jgi:hypothetical protein
MFNSKGYASLRQRMTNHHHRCDHYCAILSRVENKESWNDNKAKLLLNNCVNFLWLCFIVHCEQIFF